MPSKTSPTALHSTNATRTASSAYVLRRIAGAEAVDPHAAGTVIAQGTTGETVTTPAGLRVWAGKAGDPFWIEPDVLHAVGHAFQDGTVVDLSAGIRARRRTCLPATLCTRSCWKCPTRTARQASDNRRIGVWAVATLATDAGGWRSINRVGLPMIHPLFTQYNEDLGNRLNAGRPADDFATYGEPSSKAIAGVVAANGTAEDPRAYAEKVAHRFFPTSSPTRSALRRCSALPSGTAAP